MPAAITARVAAQSGPTSQPHHQPVPLIRGERGNGRPRVRACLDQRTAERAGGGSRALRFVRHEKACLVHDRAMGFGCFLFGALRAGRVPLPRP